MPTDEHLSGQQLHALQKQMAEELRRRVDDVALRKECLNMAIGAIPANAPGPDVIALAVNMYNFITSPMREVKVTIDPPNW